MTLRNLFNLFLNFSIVEQCLNQMPEGDISTDDAKCVPPSRHEMKVIDACDVFNAFAVYDECDACDVFVVCGLCDACDACDAFYAICHKRDAH